MSDISTNPAGRLHDLLRAAQSKSDKEPARNVWAAVFGVDPKDRGQLLKMLADLIDLVHDTKAALERLDGIDHGLFLRPFKKIETALSRLNLDATWNNWKQHLDEPTLQALQFCSHELGKSVAVGRIDEEELSNILGEVERLSKKVIEIDLPVRLKETLASNLEKTRYAILVYKIRGIDGIEEELERGLGSLFLHRDAIENAQDDEQSKGTLKAFVDILVRLHKIVAFARDTKELVAPTIDRLIG